MKSPRKPHLDAIRQIVDCVKTTAHYDLFCEHDKSLDIHGLIDAYWTDSSYDRSSTNDYDFIVGNVVVSCSSKKQPIFVLSST